MLAIWKQLLYKTKLPSNINQKKSTGSLLMAGSLFVFCKHAPLGAIFVLPWPKTQNPKPKHESSRIFFRRR